MKQKEDYFKIKLVNVAETIDRVNRSDRAGEFLTSIAFAETRKNENPIKKFILFIYTE